MFTPVDRTSVISFFDRLIASDLQEDGILARAASGLGCSLGITTQNGTSLSADATGTVAAQPPPEGATIKITQSGDRVWVSSGPGQELAELIVEELAVALRASRLRNTGNSSSASQVRAVLESPKSSDAALRALGIKAGEPVRVFAAAGPEAGLKSVTEQLRQLASGVQTAAIGQIFAIIAQNLPDEYVLDFPVGTHAGVSSPCTPARLNLAWQQARVGLLFTQPSTHDRAPYTRQEGVCIESPPETMGAIESASEPLSPIDIAFGGEAVIIDKLVAKHGAEMLRTLDIVAATASVREAARRLHVHHSTAAQRIKQIEEAFGFPIDNHGRNRLFLAITFRRIRKNSALFEPMSDVHGPPWSAHR